jgi:hypothetical protein
MISNRLVCLALVALSMFALGAVAAAQPPGMLSKAPETSQGVDIDSTFTDAEVGSEAAWKAEVEAALKFLYERQESILERLAKVEAALISVKTASGTVQQRTVPIAANGVGEFQLGPGETLQGYVDPGTGQYVQVSAVPTTRVQYRQTVASPPVRTYTTYSTPGTTVSVQPIVRGTGPVRGLIRLVRGGCCG